MTDKTSVGSSKDVVDGAFNRAVAALGELFAGKKLLRDRTSVYYSLTFSGERFAEANTAMHDLGLALRRLPAPETGSGIRAPERHAMFVASECKELDPTARKLLAELYERCRHWPRIDGGAAQETPVELSVLDAAFFEALDACGIKEPLAVYDSNSYRRVGLANQHRELVYAEAQRSDGHLSIHGTALLRAMVAAFNAMLAHRPSLKASAPHKYATYGPCHICGGAPADPQHALNGDV